VHLRQLPNVQILRRKRQPQLPCWDAPRARRSNLVVGRPNLFMDFVTVSEGGDKRIRSQTAKY